MNKKGQGISMTYVIIAALALVVLAVVILFFTGALGTLVKTQKETVTEASSQQQDIWRGQCKLYCTLEQKENWCTHIFKGPTDNEDRHNIYVCNTATFEREEDLSDLYPKMLDTISLGVNCEDIKSCV